MANEPGIDVVGSAARVLRCGSRCRARHPPEHRYDPAARRLSGCRSPHHRASGFSGIRPRFRRAGMDYLDRRDRPPSDWSIRGVAPPARARGSFFHYTCATSYLDHAYRDDDVLLFGREVSRHPSTCIRRPIRGLSFRFATGLRSLNVAMAAAMALGEAMRKSGGRNCPGLIAGTTNESHARRRIERIMRIWGRRTLKKARGGEVHFDAPGRCPLPTSLAGAQSPQTRLQIPRTSGGRHRTPRSPQRREVFA